MSAALVTGTGLRWSLILAGASLLAACGGSGDSNGSATVTPADSGLSAVASLGEKIFRDQSLSASGQQSCASCHSPDHAHAASSSLSVELGGAQLDQQGFRAVPSLRYLNLTPAFYFAEDGTPTGGFDRDGRAQSLAEQAQRPFLAPHEMANAGKAEVVASLKRAPYAAAFRQAFGATILDDADAAFKRIAFALQQY